MSDLTNKIDDLFESLYPDEKKEEVTKTNPLMEQVHKEVQNNYKGPLKKREIKKVIKDNIRLKKMARKE